MEKQPNSKSCFLCGLQNEHGLKATWYSDNENNQAICNIIIPEDYNSYPGITHGGIVAALLDETSARAVMLNGNNENLMLTMKMEVTYRKPTPTKTPLTIVGWAEMQTKSRAKVKAEIRLSDGTVTASCSSILVRPPKNISEKMETERDGWKVY